MKKLIGLVFFLLIPAVADAAIVKEPVEYYHGVVALEGYLVYDDSTTIKRPGILVAHEWKGLNDYAKSRAEQLAELGYVAFAIDMYGKGVLAKDHDEAAQLSAAYFKDRMLMRYRANAGLEVLQKHKLVDTDKIGAIGYCFGGAAVLELARAGYDLKGVVSFHGILKTLIPALRGVVKSKILVLHGADDTFVSPEDIEAFHQEMKNIQADWQFVSFGGATHSFTVPAAGNDKSKGMAYHADADRRSWAMMRNFFEEIFLEA